MNKTFLVGITILLVGALGFSQKKKDLIEQVAQLKSKTAEMQVQLDKMQAEKELNLEDEQQKFSYAFGVGMGANLKNMGFDSLSYTSFATAMEDVMLQQEKMPLEEAQRLVQTTIATRQEVVAKEKSAEGERFLAENGKKSEVVTTESGLQYEVLTKGDGVLPTTKDKVKVHYSGMLTNGKVFDSSIERGEPAVFGVTQVIKGWTEALQLMPVGSKWKVFIPQDLGYGQRGAGNGMIPPYSALIFEMELLAIE